MQWNGDIYEQKDCVVIGSPFKSGSSKQKVLDTTKNGKFPFLDVLVSKKQTVIWIKIEITTPNKEQTL